MEKKIIPARLADAVLLKNIDDVSFDKIFHEDMEYYNDCFKNGNECYLLMVDNLPAGEIILRFENEETLGLESFAIVPQFRKHKLSKFLLEFVNERAESFKRIILEVYVNNKKAIDIYNKNGYNIIGSEKDYYAPGYDAYIMEKKL